MLCGRLCTEDRTMASSLSAKCTPLKLEYDSCFNAWFEGYLEPLADPSTTTEERRERSAQKAREYEESCGKVWESYRECIQVCGGDFHTERGLIRDCRLQ